MESRTFAALAALALVFAGPDALAATASAAPPNVDQIHNLVDVTQKFVDAWTPVAQWALGPAGLAAWAAALLPKTNGGGLLGLLRGVIDLVGGNVLNAKNAE